jgi:hypothetical protein
MLWVWVVVAGLAVVALGLLAYVVLGAVGRLRREVAGAREDLRPVLEQLQATAARVEARGASGPDRRANTG